MPTRTAYVGSEADAFVLSLELQAGEVAEMRAMLTERINGELELAEDLQALGRPFAQPIRRAGLAWRIDAALAEADSRRW